MGGGRLAVAEIKGGRPSYEQGSSGGGLISNHVASDNEAFATGQWVLAGAVEQEYVMVLGNQDGNSICMFLREVPEL